MEKCTYKLFFKDGNNIEFDSLIELDYYLSNNTGINLDKIESSILFKSREEHAIEVLENMQEEIKSKIIKTETKYDPTLGGIETYSILDDSIGVSRVITDVPINGSRLVTPFNEKDYFDEQGYSQNQRNVVSGGWGFETSTGTIFHKILEHSALVASYENPNDVEELVLSEKEKSMLGDNWEQIVSSLEERFEKFISGIKDKHGKNCKIFPEMQILSKVLDNPILGKNTINGKIDLLVIDENGYAHIYDYKISKKEPGTWSETSNKLIEKDQWSSAKKLGIEYQMELYRSILAQYGVTVASVNIVPIKIKYKTNNVDGIDVPVSVTSFYFGNTIKDGSGGLYRRQSKIQELLPEKHVTDKIDGLKSIHEPMSIMFPNYDLETKNARDRVKRDSVIKSAIRLKDDDKDRDKGLYKFQDKFKKTEGGWVYCKDLEDLENKATEYVNKINEMSANEWLNISDQLSAISDGSQDFESLTLSSSSQDENTYFRRIFKKFFTGTRSWKYNHNDTLAVNGIFVFTDDTGLMEIVTLTNQSISQIVNLGKGTSLLGADKRDYQIDEHKTLKATNGNLNIMKVICLINANPEIFEGHKISSIQVHNTRDQRGTEEQLDVMFSIFQDAARLHDIEVNIDDNQFVSIFEFVEHKVEEVTGESIMKQYGFSFSYSIDDKLDGIDKLEKIRKILLRNDVVYREVNSEKPNFDIPLVELYAYVSHAIARLKGYSIYVEPDPAAWLQTNGSLHAGTQITSAELSPSLNIQNVGNVVSRAAIAIRQRTTESVSKYRKTLKALIDSKNVNPLMGAGISVFKNLFREDGNGNRDPRFLLKHESDPSLTKEESEFIKVFLEIVNGFKYNNDQNRIAEIRDTDIYYEVPIAMASDQTLRQTLSLKKAAKKSYDEATNFIEIFQQQREEFEGKIKQKHAYNKYSIGADKRRQILGEVDPDLIETDLENVLLDFIWTHHKEDVWNEVLPQIQAIKLVLQYKHQFFGQDVTETINYIDKYIELNVFNKPIMDKQLQAPYRFLSAIKSFTSATVLGFNMRSGLRELMQGMWNHLSRSTVQMYGKNMFKSSEVLKAWTIVFKLSWKNPNLMSLLDCVNAEYGMANVDISGIKELLKMTKTGIKNFSSDTLYIFNRIPDSYHRLGILIAQMIHDGCWDAHYQDEDGNLVYDFSKDERFNLLTNPNANKDSDEYKSQLSLYLTMADELRNDGYTIEQFNANKPIPPLPRAYTFREGLSIKSFADLCFGHYDKNTQMLAKHAFLGSFFLQFRTFISAKLEQWILKPGTYNIGKYVEKEDVDGVKIMRVIHFDENGVPVVTLKREDELNPEDKIVTPFKEWQGRFMEGILYSIWDFGKALYKMDRQALKELWANDTKRANFYLFLNDMVFYSILMAILGSLFFGDKDTEWTPGSHMAAMALYTSFSDGPITQLLSSMGGDLNPPLYSQVKTLYNNSISIITGDKNVGDWFTGSFGALRDLEYMVS